MPANVKPGVTDKMIGVLVTVTVTVAGPQGARLAVTSRQ
jgi:hypothetical protein